MISDRLKKREVFVERGGKHYDPQAVAVIGTAVRKLVLAMASLEAHGVMNREDIEDCVLKAFERAEMLYCGMTETELTQIVEMEIRNDKGREKHIKRI